MTEYARVLKLAEKQVKAAQAAGESPYPVVLEERLASWTAGQGSSLGVIDIPVSLIVGTCTRGRQNLLSQGFLPLAKESSEFATKWEALYESQLNEGLRDPIEVYEYLQRFYVQEGNKRVSVAHVLGMPSIEAKVMRVLPHAGDEGYESYQAFLRFWKVCPLYGIEFADPSSYGKLAKLLGLGLDEPWAEEDVLRLKAFLALFEACLAEVKVVPNQSVCDALLTYLSYYPGHNAAPVSKQELSNRLTSIWGTPSAMSATVGVIKSAGKGALGKVRSIGHAHQPSEDDGAQP